METLRISLVQSFIFWEDKQKNIQHYDALLKPLIGKTDIVVLPEMFSTGFSTDNRALGESNNGETLKMVRKFASEYNFAVCGSFLALEHEKLFNRGFFITPEGEEFFYDKRHLFRIGSENKNFTHGSKQLIVPYKGWNICLIICYDLRFPVWSRNVANSYDLLICPANWPEARKNVWEVLLKVRAIENSCYVCGVNRIGEDGFHNYHQGDSQLIDFKGNAIVTCASDHEVVTTGIISKEKLDQFRKKFPVWLDADRFEIIYR